METHPSVLFESETFIVLDKPAGWLSVPARVPQPTDRVMSHHVSEITGAQSFVIHRLDRFTSGVMIFAKTKDAHRTGNSWFEKRIVKKTYHFLASPPPTLPAVQIRTPVQGKPAQTLFEVLEKAGSYFYGKATPLTGRFHQIRDHAAHAGFPLLGDAAFSGKPAHRVCLHAYSLETPIGVFVAPFANDLIQIWSNLKHESTSS